MANLYVEFFKELALWSAPAKSRRWKRNVNDTCCILKKGIVAELLDDHNIWPTIKFIFELEVAGTLPFIDILLQREEGGNLDIMV